VKAHLLTACCCLAFVGTARLSATEALPGPGDPRHLVDWRRLARPLVGTNHVVADPMGAKKLPKTDGGFRILDVKGPGVMDHFWTVRSNAATVIIEVDGERLWHGRLGTALQEAKRKGAGGVLPYPVAFEAANQCHVLAPIGFQQRLRLISSKKTYAHHVSYRTFPKGTVVAAARETGTYPAKLREAAEEWKKPGYDFRPTTSAKARTIAKEFALPVTERVTVLRVPGSGEVMGIEFHMIPALTGSLRNVVVEFFYDGADKPALRLPITDLAGQPHPWVSHRWDRHQGTLAACTRFPWQVHTPRTYYPEVTFHVNLPIPFADGLKIDLVNRSRDHQFTGSVKATVNPLSRSDAKAAGRLCGTRRLVSVEAGKDPKPMLRLPGRGQIVGLGLFMTGNAVRAPASKKGVVALTVDDKKPITGPGVVPLWFQGGYGAPAANQPIWNHPRMQENFVGAMRYFLTDPVPFRASATLAYTPGTDAAGAPKQAAAIALWYRFDRLPYAAPELPAQARPLPHSSYAFGRMAFGQGKQRRYSRNVWAVEAEDMVPMMTSRGCLVVDAVEDVEHNYHPSKGKYLRVVAEQIGGHADCAVRLPQSPYVGIATNSLWGPVRGTYELDLVSVKDAKGPALLPQTGISGRALWAPPLKARILMSASLRHLRDTGAAIPVPLRNPAPDGKGILRFLCVGTAKEGSAALLAIDQVRLEMPPPTDPGWHDFEEGVLPETKGEASAFLPKYGNFNWFGWGAVTLRAPKGGTARVRLTSITGPARPKTLTIRGTLGPDQGGWTAQVGDSGPVVLKPGKDAKKDVVAWTFPLKGVTLPGTITVTFTCTDRGVRKKGQVVPPFAGLSLDAWKVE